MSYDLLLRENTSNEIINRYYLKNEEETINHLPNVNKINIFVGANNSGKSWMMRYLMNLKDFKYFDNESIKNKLEYFNNHQYVQHFAKNLKPQSFQNQGIALFFLYFSQVRGLSRTLK